jgi:hypothetical protein
VIGLDRIIRILLDVMPRRGQHLIENGGIDRRGVTTSLGLTFSVRMARVKNRRAAVASRREESSTSMTWPYWSTTR